MKKYIKEFIKRGLVFGALGPMIAGLVYMIIDFCGVALSLKGYQIFIAIITSYLLAFVQAGASIFPSIEEWSTFKELVIHLLTIYLIYLFTYLVNSWIEFQPMVILIFSLIVIGSFLLIWLITFILVNKLQNNLNKQIKK